MATCLSTNETCRLSPHVKSAGMYALVEEDGEAGLLRLALARLHPARDVGVPAEVARVDVEDAGARHCRRRRRAQVRDLEDEPHVRR